MPNETAPSADRSAAEPRPVAPRSPFDRWLWDRDIDNVEAARMFDSHPMSIGRWRKRFDDPGRRTPPYEKMLEIAEKTGGGVPLESWRRPPVADPVSSAPEAAQ